VQTLKISGDVYLECKQHAPRSFEPATGFLSLTIVEPQERIRLAWGDLTGPGHEPGPFLLPEPRRRLRPSQTFKNAYLGMR
jgi:hypothetical protein